MQQMHETTKAQSVEHPMLVSFREDLVATRINLERSRLALMDAKTREDVHYHREAVADGEYLVTLIEQNIKSWFPTATI